MDKLAGSALWLSLFKLVDEKRIDIDFVHHRRAKKKELESPWFSHLYTLLKQTPAKHSLDLDSLYIYSDRINLVYKKTRWNCNIRKF